ncbi:energy-coupling factor transporter transmembrane protein EcfT [Denitromonas iodatirespirans]|uniref:Energy-coupling factor transporter transmembrane protein EcfT n=1 Tax=Denitromonas iodatirespirans TaxID=2795389 RepID=A0A944HAN5_DENI1|nr:energy-coupling factor transporter transmembrane protein EcfT [Denitromonas iodatirespirans]MBT0960787.1 hypothetical protein [Denitromonas iodatirespirans]
MISLHPAATLSLWAGVAVFIQTLPPVAMGLAALLVFAAALVIDRVRTLKLVRRIRILLAVILLMFAFATPGTAVLPHWVALSPTWDGVSLGATHAGRLLAMVSMVSILLAKMPIPQLVLALHVLSAVLAPLGVSADRVAVRLSLVLAELDAPRLAWKTWLDTVEAPAEPRVLTLDARALRQRDHVVITSVVLLAALVWWL